MADQTPTPAPRARALPGLKVAQRMTRRDSLQSLGEFGQVVPLEQQPAMRAAAAAKKRKPGNPFEALMRTLTGN